MGIFQKIETTEGDDNKHTPEPYKVFVREDCRDLLTWLNVTNTSVGKGIGGPRIVI